MEEDLVGRVWEKGGSEGVGLCVALGSREAG